MISKQLLVTEEEIEDVWGSANFGDEERIDVVKYGLLKCASGYYQGHTSKRILEDLSLITKKYKLTKRGGYCLWNWLRNGSNI